MKRHVSKNRNQQEFVQIRITKELKNKLQEHSKELNVTMSMIIKELVEDYLDRSEWVLEENKEHCSTTSQNI